MAWEEKLVFYQARLHWTVLGLRGSEDCYSVLTASGTTNAARLGNRYDTAGEAAGAIETFFAKQSPLATRVYTHGEVVRFMVESVREVPRPPL